MGHVIDSKSIEINKNNLKKDFIVKERPKNLKDLQRPLGCLNWYRNFFPNISTKIKPLTDKLNTTKDYKKKRLIFWNKEDEECLLKILKEIENCNKLSFPRFDSEFYLDTDASNYGIGSVLYQKHGVISYYSKKLIGAEINYSVAEKKFLAILRSLQFFRNIIQ